MPQQACVCEQIVKGTQKIKISTDKKRYGKIVTIVSGFDSGVDVKAIAKKLKSKLACGGTSKENKIELQGDHRQKVKKLLVEEGFDEESIQD